MDNEEEAAPAQALGTTMRIDLSPERLEEARRSKARMEGRPPTQPIINIPRPSQAPAVASPDFQQLLQNIYDAVLITEMNGEIVLSNVRANQFFYALPNQLRHYSILGLIGGADDTLLPMIMEALKANRFVLMQAYCVRTDGSFFAAEVSVNRMRLAEKDHLSFFIRDITLRREQEDRLRTGNTALQNSSSGVAIAGLEGRIEYANPAFIALHAATDPAQVIEREWRDFLVQPTAAEEILGITSTGQTWSGELEMRRVDETLFFGQASVAPNLNADNQQIGVVISVLDITPSKLAQQQLQTYATELHTRNAQMQEDLNIASELHRAFLPDGFKHFPAGALPEEAWLHVSKLYCPSGTIGGDFYDVRALSEHEVALFISDVMGHGIRSALVVATIRGLVEQFRTVAGDPGALMTQLNATYSTIFQQMGGNVIFSTALYAVIDTRTGVVRCANASHPRPYVLRREEGRCEHVELGRKMRSAPLGIFPETVYTTCEFQLGLNDLLLLYTDGLTEVESPQGELFETERLEQTLLAQLKNPGEQVLEALVEEAKVFSQRETFDDDVCLLAIELAKLAEPASILT